MVGVMKQEQREVGREVAEDSIGKLAHTALRKYFRQTIQQKKAVLKDTDPEPLHQMRVGLRRMRTTLLTYGFAIHLPQAASEPTVKKLAKTLGHVRDIDVLTHKLEHEYRPALPQKEQVLIDRVLKHQRKSRKQHFSKLTKTLKGKPYRQFESAYKGWLKQPVYGILAPYPVQLMAADVLAPLLSRTLLHPAWFCSREYAENDVTPTTLNHWLTQDGVVLHDLRKQVKLLRYQVEFLSSRYGNALLHPAEQFKQIQDLLGQFQDLWVLNEVLGQTMNRRWMMQSPVLAQQLIDEQVHLWASWQPMVEQFLSPTYRAELRRAIASL